LLLQLKFLVIDLLAFLLYAGSILSQVLDFLGKSLDLLEDAAIKFPDQEVLVLVVDEDLVRIDGDGIE
jgi:hypothetical protein